MDTLFCFFGIESKLESGLHVCGIPVGSGVFLSERASLCWQDARRVLGLILEAPRDPNNVDSGRVEDSGVHLLGTQGVMLAELQGLARQALGTE